MDLKDFEFFLKRDLKRHGLAKTLQYNNLLNQIDKWLINIHETEKKTNSDCHAMRGERTYIMSLKSVIRKLRHNAEEEKKWLEEIYSR